MNNLYQYVIVQADTMHFDYNDGRTHDAPSTGRPVFVFDNKEDAVMQMDKIAEAIRNHTYWALPEDGIDRHVLQSDRAFNDSELLRSILVTRDEQLPLYKFHGTVTINLWQTEQNCAWGFRSRLHIPVPVMETLFESVKYFRASLGFLWSIFGKDHGYEPDGSNAYEFWSNLREADKQKFAEYAATPGLFNELGWALDVAFCLAVDSILRTVRCEIVNDLRSLAESRGLRLEIEDEDESGWTTVSILDIK